MEPTPTPENTIPQFALHPHKRPFPAEAWNEIITWAPPAIRQCPLPTFDQHHQNLRTRNILLIGLKQIDHFVTRAETEENGSERHRKWQKKQQSLRFAISMIEAWSLAENEERQAGNAKVNSVSKPPAFKAPDPAQTAGPTKPSQQTTLPVASMNQTGLLQSSPAVNLTVRILVEGPRINQPQAVCIEDFDATVKFQNLPLVTPIATVLRALGATNPKLDFLEFEMNSKEVTRDRNGVPQVLPAKFRKIGWPGSIWYNGELMSLEDLVKFQGNMEGGCFKLDCNYRRRWVDVEDITKGIHVSGLPSIRTSDFSDYHFLARPPPAELTDPWMTNPGPVGNYIANLITGLQALYGEEHKVTKEQQKFVDNANTLIYCWKQEPQNYRLTRQLVIHLNHLVKGLEAVDLNTKDEPKRKTEVVPLPKALKIPSVSDTAHPLINSTTGPPEADQSPAPNPFVLPPKPLTRKSEPPKPGGPINSEMPGAWLWSFTSDDKQQAMGGIGDILSMNEVFHSFPPSSNSRSLLKGEFGDLVAHPPRNHHDGPSEKKVHNCQAQPAPGSYYGNSSKWRTRTHQGQSGLSYGNSSDWKTRIHPNESSPGSYYGNSSKWQKSDGGQSRPTRHNPKLEVASKFHKPDPTTGEAGTRNIEKQKLHSANNGKAKGENISASLRKRPVQVPSVLGPVIETIPQFVGYSAINPPEPPQHAPVVKSPYLQTPGLDPKILDIKNARVELWCEDVMRAHSAPLYIPDGEKIDFTQKEVSRRMTFPLSKFEWAYASSGDTAWINKALESYNPPPSVLSIDTIDPARYRPRPKQQKQQQQEEPQKEEPKGNILKPGVNYPLRQPLPFRRDESEGNRFETILSVTSEKCFGQVEGFELQHPPGVFGGQVAWGAGAPEVTNTGHLKELSRMLFNQLTQPSGAQDSMKDINKVGDNRFNEEGSKTYNAQPLPSLEPKKCRCSGDFGGAEYCQRCSNGRLDNIASKEMLETAVAGIINERVGSAVKKVYQDLEESLGIKIPAENILQIPAPAPQKTPPKFQLINESNIAVPQIQKQLQNLQISQYNLGSIAGPAAKDFIPKPKSRLPTPSFGNVPSVKSLSPAPPQWLLGKDQTGLKSRKKHSMALETQNTAERGNEEFFMANEEFDSIQNEISTLPRRETDMRMSYLQQLKAEFQQVGQPAAGVREDRDPTHQELSERKKGKEAMKTYIDPYGPTRTGIADFTQQEVFKPAVKRKPEGTPISVMISPSSSLGDLIARGIKKETERRLARVNSQQTKKTRMEAGRRSSEAEEDAKLLIESMGFDGNSSWW
ncbi:hypothetical protein ABW19_dt0204762 [Dactylella cylindrospora]|nr:hypothetical protein ABW19_dt0204762 [Dactylella cylindrospora]